MYSKYQDFISEAKKKFEFGSWYKDNKYTIDTDDRYIVHDDVYIHNENLISIPLDFKKIEGGFYCYSNKLTSLKGCPEIVEGSFNCSTNPDLISLEYGPYLVGGNYFCNNLNIDYKDPETYPQCIIKRVLFVQVNGISNDGLYRHIQDIIKENIRSFEPLVHDKIKFHQMIMRLDNSLINLYKTIPKPTKNSHLIL